jgi:hypothetical protein
VSGARFVRQTSLGVLLRCLCGPAREAVASARSSVLLGSIDQVTGRKPRIPERLVAGNPCVRGGLAEFLGYSDAFLHKARECP